MRRSVVVVLALGAALVLSTVAGASTKFSSTEAIAVDGSLIVNFDEGSLKRFASVDYRLDATATAFFQIDTSAIGRVYNPSATVMLTPDEGRVTGALELDIDQSGRCLLFPCGTLLYVEYSDITLTNLATGKTYRLHYINQGEPPSA